MSTVATVLMLSVIVPFAGSTVTIKYPTVITQDELNAVLNAPKFKAWEEAIAQDGNLEVRVINLKGVFMFGKAVGFVFMCTETYDKKTGKQLPGVVFLRGDSVAILMILVDDVTGDKYVAYTIQPRVASAESAMIEITAGMVDENTHMFKSVATKELKEELDVDIIDSELVSLGSMTPSGGATQETIHLYMCTKTVSHDAIVSMIGKRTGEEETLEQIIVGVKPLAEFRQMCLDGHINDAKAMCALYRAKL